MRSNKLLLLILFFYFLALYLKAEETDASIKNPSIMLNLPDKNIVSIHQRNLKLLHLACMLYSDKYGKLPKNLDVLKEFDKEKLLDNLVPIDKDHNLRAPYDMLLNSYRILLPGKMDMYMEPEDTVLITTRTVSRNQVQYAIFLDGHFEMVPISISENDIERLYKAITENQEQSGKTVK